MRFGTLGSEHSNHALVLRRYLAFRGLDTAEVVLYESFAPCFESNFGVIQGDPWTVCSIDQNHAWVAANTGGTYQADQICQMLGFNTLADWGGTCGDVCGYCQNNTDCMNLGNMNFDGGGDQNFPQLSFTVHWLCTP